MERARWWLRWTSARPTEVHPCDWPLLGMKWKGAIFLDAALSFGLRSAPLIFTAVADALLNQWIIKSMGVQWVAHYINDFIMLGAPDSTECKDNASTMREAYTKVSLPVEPKKDKGPATTISFICIELDSVAVEIRLLKKSSNVLRKSCLCGRAEKPVQQ